MDELSVNDGEAPPVRQSHLPSVGLEVPDAAHAITAATHRQASEPLRAAEAHSAQFLGLSLQNRGPTASCQTGPAERYAATAVVRQRHCLSTTAGTLDDRAKIYGCRTDI